MPLLDDTAVGLRPGAETPAPSPSSSGAGSPSTSGLLDDVAVGIKPPDPTPSQRVLQGLKATGGEAAALADLVLSLPGMALGLGANLGAQIRAQAGGETPKIAAQAGREASERIGGVISNPVQKLLNLFDSGEAYEHSKTTAGMQKLTEWVGEAGAWVEKKTGGRVPAEQMSTLVDTLMVAGGTRGADAAVDAGVKAWLAREKPKAPPADFSPQKVQAAGPQRTAQQQINESLDIKSANEKEKYNAQRRKEVRQAFAGDKDYADYLKFLADERVSRHDAWNAETARLEEAEHQAYKLGVTPAKPTEVTWNDALRVLKKPGFERTAEDLITLRRFNTQALPFVATGAIMGGVAADYVLYPEHRERIATGLGVGGALLAVKGKGGMWHPEAVERLSQPLAERLVTQGERRQIGGEGVPEHLEQSAKDADAWTTSRVRTYLNRWAGTEGDPLKDVEIPGVRYDIGTDTWPEGTVPWGEEWDRAITQTPAKDYERLAKKPVLGARPDETVFDVTHEKNFFADEGSTISQRNIVSYLSHVGDYLREHVPPAKLQQYDLVRAVKETAKWDAELAKKMNSVEGRAEGTVPFKKYPDGYQWVEVGKHEGPLPKDYEIKQLGDKFGKTWWVFKDGKRITRQASHEEHGTTPYEFPGDFESKESAEYAARRLIGDEALKREGDVMGHCVGGYCDYVESGEAKIYSLRDPKGMSHVTVEVQPPGVRKKPYTPEDPGEDSIIQIKGKQNRAPEPRYLPYVQDFVKSGKWGEVGDLANAGLVKVAGKYLTRDEIRRADWKAEETDTAGHYRILGNEGQVIQKEMGHLKGDPAGALQKFKNLMAGDEDWQRRFRGEAGFLDSRLAARMAAVGLGITAGVYLDPSNPVEGAILGALGGLAAGSVSPKGVADVVRKAFASDDRLRVNKLANEHEYQVAAAARAIHQVQSKIEQLAPNPVDRIAITHAIESGDLSGLSPKNAQAARLAQEYFAEMARVGQESGVLKDALDNYVTHLWKMSDKAKDLLQKIFASKSTGPSMSPESKSALRRTVPTIAEGKAKGLEPVSEDVSVILGLYGQAINRSMANKQLLTALRQEVDPLSNTRLVLPSGKALPTYVSIDHPQMTGMRVHPDIAPSLRFVFDHSNPGVVARGLEGINVLTKRMAVSFSLFHAKALADAFIGAANNPAAVFKQLAQAAAPKLFGENLYIKQLREGGAGDLVDMAQKGGLKFSMERAAPAVEDVSGTFYTAMKDLQGGLDAIVPGLGLPVKAFTKLNHLVDRFMWERLHAGMKLSIFAEKYNTLLQNNALAHEKNGLVPIRPKEEIAAMAADFTNSIFGGLNWRRVAESASTRWGREAALAAYSPTGRRVLQVLLFAPDWTVSTTRAALQAFSEGSGLKGLIKPQTVGDLHRQYIIRSAIYYVAAGDAINVAMSGHHIWENKDPTTIDLGDGRTMQWSKHTMEPVHWLTKPGQQGLNKLGFVPREVANQLLGTEYLSTSGHAPRMSNRLAHVARQFTPIAVQQSFEAGNESGIAGFLGAPIYGKTTEQRQREKEERRLKRALGR